MSGVITGKRDLMSKCAGARKYMTRSRTKEWYEGHGGLCFQMLYRGNELEFLGCSFTSLRYQICTEQFCVPPFYSWEQLIKVSSPTVHTVPPRSLPSLLALRLPQFFPHLLLTAFQSSHSSHPSQPHIPSQSLFRLFLSQQPSLWSSSLFFRFTLLQLFKPSLHIHFTNFNLLPYTHIHF